MRIISESKSFKCNLNFVANIPSDKKDPVNSVLISDSIKQMYAIIDTEDIVRLSYQHIS